MDHPFPIMTPVRTKQGSTPGRHITADIIGIVSDFSSTGKGYRYNVMISPREWNRHHGRQTDQYEVLRFYDDELETTEEAPE